MADRAYDLNGVRVLELDTVGTAPRTARDAADLVSAAWHHQAKVVAAPVDRLGDDFFRLETGIAGEIMQKFVNYRLHLAIVGDISRYVAESTALRDLVYESNKGDQVCFVADLQGLAERLVRWG